MSTRTDTIASLQQCWGSLGTLGAGLTDEQWAAASLCPEWSVQGVLAHVTAIEEALTGWWPDGPEAAPPFRAAGAIQAELGSVPPAIVLARFRAAVEERRAELAALDDAAFATPCRTPVGPATYGRFMAVRVFDCWVHERDIRVALGVAGDDGGPAAEIALDEVRGALGYVVGKRIGAPEGSGIAFALTGPVHARLLVEVDRRATVVDELAAPDVTLTTDSLTFMLLACGRIDPEAAIADGRVTWAGDDELGGRAARNLRFTM